MNTSVNRGKSSNDLLPSNRLSRRSSNPRSNDRHNGKNIEKMVSQLKEEYAIEARLSKYSQLAKAKSEHNFQPSQAAKRQP